MKTMIRNSFRFLSPCGVTDHGKTLIQVLAVIANGTKPLPESMLAYHNAVL